MSDVKNVDKVTEQALLWYEGNLLKNDGATIERKAEEQLKKLVSDGEIRTVEISKTHELKIGFMEDQTEEIDPKKLFEQHPDKFWELVSIAKGNCVSLIGEKDTAKLMRTKVTNKFRVRKVKKTS